MLKTARKKQNQSSELEHIRHSLAHVLASAVVEMFPKAKLGVGPVIENGFFYDFQIPRPFTPEDLKKLENRMRALVREGLPFKRQEMTAEKAKEFFKKRNQPFKVELIKDIEKFGTTKANEILNTEQNSKKTFTKKAPTKNVKVSLYTTGNFIDLCRGGHVASTKEIAPESFKLDKMSGAYWRGDEKNPQLQRIYGLSFASKEDLITHVNMLEEARRRDHKKLGPELDLFTFSDLVGAGLPLWTPKGTLLRDTLDAFVWKLRKKHGYMRVEIPHITKKDLYEKSGHWDKFKDDLFRITTREGHEFAMKPMNCPHHIEIYARRQWSYRELPQRYANTTMVYRDEQSGELAGLSRVRSITQDDAHVFCRISQAKEEFLKVWDIIHEFYGAFGFKLRVRLSLHDPKQPEKYLGDKKLWKFAEDMLRKIAQEKKADAFEAPGEAAFYGPKLDFLAKDSLGREWQVATIQLDMNMPERFDLTCVNENGESERIVMVHAAIMGAIERFVSIAIEHFAGAFPLWLSPVQVAILPVGEKFEQYANTLRSEFEEKNIRVEVNSANETLGKRIREAEMQKIPYVAVVGEREMQEGTVSVRARGATGKKDEVMKMESFIEKLTEEVEKKA
jgi:threonyl-tRNA synthetase